MYKAGRPRPATVKLKGHAERYCSSPLSVVRAAARAAHHKKHEYFRTCREQKVQCLHFRGIEPASSGLWGEHSTIESTVSERQV